MSILFWGGSLMMFSKEITDLHQELEMNRASLPLPRNELEK